jgi:alpha-D-ribose 1-methylphosphonate 5-triphosphate synthase subunit PhnL
VVFNNTYPLYNKSVVNIPENHDVKNKQAAIDLWQAPNKTYLGIFHQSEIRDSFAERCDKIIELAQSKGKGDTNQLLDSYR